MVVADGRVLENFSLKVNESSLTGESEGVEKTADVITGGQVALGDQKSMVFSGSLVTYGRATVLVTATGMNTELGKIAALNEPDPSSARPPCSSPWTASSAKLAIVIMAICAVGVCPVGVPYRHGSAGLPHVRRGPGGGRHPRGPQLHRHHCAGHGAPRRWPNRTPS